MTSKLPTIDLNKILDMNFGIKNNVEFKDGKLTLSLSKIHDDIRLYKSNGQLEYKHLDLDKYFLKIIKLDIDLISSGLGSCKIYTATSKDRVNYNQYLQINEDGTINSEQNRYLNIKIEINGIQENVDLVRNNFDKEEENEFDYSENIEFNNSLSLKNNYIVNPKDKIKVNNSLFYKHYVDKSQLNKLNKISLYED